MLISTQFAQIISATETPLGCGDLLAALVVHLRDRGAGESRVLSRDLPFSPSSDKLSAPDR
jgi:hypothetical protein